MSDHPHHSHHAPPPQPPPSAALNSSAASASASSCSSVSVHNHQAHASGYDHDYTHRHRSLSQHANPHQQLHPHPHPQALEALHLAGIDSDKQFMNDDFGYHYHSNTLPHTHPHHHPPQPHPSQARYDHLGQLPVAIPTGQLPPAVMNSQSSISVHHSPSSSSSSSRSRRVPSTPSSNKPRRFRLSWTDEETQYLMQGCRDHGVGNWKKILHDPKLKFNNRTAVDLKDRFRTSFPAEYSRLYPNARTHKGRVCTATLNIQPLVKINRKERRSFSAKEDKALLEGFERYGPAWSLIQRDPVLGLDSRRSTDLRDRFRNAYPDRYIAAGYKGRPKKSNRSDASPQVQEFIKKEFVDSSIQQPPHAQQDHEMGMVFNRQTMASSVPPAWRMFYQSHNANDSQQIVSSQLADSAPSPIPIHRQWESK